MLVYGDHSERIDPRERLTEIAASLRCNRLSHEELVEGFIALSGIAQGVADADFETCGSDRPRPVETELLAALTQIAQRLLQSWDKGQTGGAGVAFPVPSNLPPEVEIRLPEGYAFYALRPEAYALAARELKLLASPRIVGLRSIGTGLACIAAAALGSAPPITLRPTGHPFARALRIAPELETALLQGEAHFVIVDEGPGLSGSSFGAVADWLEAHGVPLSHIAFLPGHTNPLGPQASEQHRQRWAIAQKRVIDLGAPDPGWLDPLIGTLQRPLRDISAGTWRPLWSASELSWPAVDPTRERRKFLAETDRGTWLVKFAGLGAIGRRKLQLARKLQEGGFGPEVAGLAQGWLVSRWYMDAVPARPTLDELIAYLRLRKSMAATQPGGSPSELLTMVRRNAPFLDHWSPDLSQISPVPVCTDNRMAAHEWLRLPSGKLLKADGLDHHAAHDLIGCQDIAWDVAGAAVELDLPASETERLRLAVGAGKAMLGFMLVAYRAFHLGAHRLSAASLGHWREEQARHLQAAERLEDQLTSIDAVEDAAHIH